MTPDPDVEQVRPIARSASLLVSALFIYFAASGSHKLSQLGLALITSGTLLATPQLVAVLFASSPATNLRGAGEAYLRLVTLLACAGVILAVLGVRGGHVALPGLDSRRLAVLILALVVEAVLIVGFIPLWLLSSIGTIAPTSLRKSCSKWVRGSTARSRRLFVWLADHNCYARLGGLCFLGGVIAQFIAGS